MIPTALAAGAGLAAALFVLAPFSGDSQTEAGRDGGGYVIEPNFDPFESAFGPSFSAAVESEDFRQLLNRDSIRPIYQPQFVPSDAAYLEPDALVIGVEINGDVKAYPVGPLVRREMVNDVVGGVPILVTW